MSDEKTDHTMRCGVCGEVFDRSNLTSVILHEHDGKEETAAQALGVKGKKVEGDTSFLQTKIEKIDALCKQLDDRDATIKHLQDKEILGDRRIVDLEHEKAVLTSETHDLGERLIEAEEENQRLKEALEDAINMWDKLDIYADYQQEIKEARKLIEP